MKKFDTNKTFKKALLGGMSVVAFTAMVGLSGAALAADTTITEANDTANTTDTTALTKTGADAFTVTGGTADTTHSTGNLVTDSGAVTIQNTTNDAFDTTVQINGNLTTTTGNLIVKNVEATNATAADPVILTITGTSSVGGTTTISTAAATSTDNASAATLVVQGNATFTGAVTMTADGAGNAGSDATLTLQGTTNAFTAGVTLNDGTGQSIINVNSTNGTTTVSGTIDGAASGEGTLNAFDDDADAAADSITFSGNVGATQGLAAINIGNTTQAGNSVFQGTVAATNITIAGGDNASETGKAEFQKGVTATTITLDKNTADATATFNATNGAMTVAGAINGTTASDGVIAVIDDDANAAPDAVTFSGTIGGTKVGSITVGNSTQGGSAIFSANATVTVDTVTVTGGDNAAEDSVVQFQHSLTATSLTLDDSTGDATATFNMTNGAQTTNAAISGASAGEGTLNVYDDDAGEAHVATFSGAVGGTSLKAINIGTTTMGGGASFGSTVAATTVTQQAGDASGENASATYAGNASITTLNLIGGGDANADAKATFQGATNSFTSISLNDATGQAELTFDANNGAMAVSGTIDGASAGEGSLTIIDADTTGAAGDLVTFSGNVGATNSLLSVNVGASAGADAANAKFSGTVAATNINVYGSSTSGETALAEFVGDVTATTFTVKGGTTDATTDATATVKGNVTATTINIDDQTGQGKLVVGGSAAQTITGAINGTTDGDGELQVTNTSGTVTFASAIGNTGTNDIDTLTLDASTTTVFKSTVNTDNAITVGDAAKLTLNGAVSTATATFANTNSTTLTIGTGFTYGSGTTTASSDVITATTGFVLTGTTANTVTVNMPSDFTSGHLVLVTTNATGTVSAAEVAAIKLVDTALVDYTAVMGDNTAYSGTSANNDIVITATAKSIGTTASELGISTQEASALKNANTAVASGDSAALTAMTTALNAGGADAKKAAEQLGVQADTLGAASTAAIGAGAQVVGVASNRLASLRSGAQFAGAQQTGFATGDAGMAKAVWLKPFGNWIQQDDKGGVKGYDADTYGIAAGLDAEVIDGVRLGASFAYSNTDVDGKGSGNSQTDIDSYQMTVYGDYTTDKYYVEGMVGYARNNNETSRDLTFGGLNRTAKGEYDSNQYMASVGAGMPINIKGDAFVTPMAGLSYTHVSSDSYTETGAGNLNLRVNPDDVDAVVASLGAKFHTKIKQGKGNLIPSATLGVSYDLAGDEAAATSTYTGGGAAFTVEGAEVEQLAGNVGVGLTYDDGAWSVGANYDAEFKSGYTGHSAMLEARFKF